LYGFRLTQPPLLQPDSQPSPAISNPGHIAYIGTTS
jgi:hypothetical protein